MRPEVIRANDLIPVGMSSPLRACRHVGVDPLVVSRATGETLFDVDGRQYVDVMYGFGPLVLGHVPTVVTDAIAAQAAKGTLFGTSCPLEVDLAEAIVGTAPFLEQLRFVCSGTEAVMSVVRVARAFTGRRKIVRFHGGYHGHSDLVQTKEQGAMPAAGLDPAAMKANMLAVYNDVEGLERLFADHGTDIAAVVVEPIAANMSLVEPHPDFLQALRRLCTEAGTLLVFDEVITGFRFTYGPVSNLLGVEPDLVTFGKVIGGGTPVGAFGGRRDVMAVLDREQVLQGGTFAGNPLTMAAGLATLAELRKPGFYEELERKGALLERSIEERRADRRLDFVLARRASVSAFIFVPAGSPIANHLDVARQDAARYASLYAAMRDAGFHLPPHVQEVMFLSSATADESIERFAAAACDAIADQLEPT